MNRSMIGFMAVCGTCASAFAAQSYTGTTISENFDSLPITPATTGVWSATVGVQADVPGLAAATWQGAKIAGTGTGLMNLIVDAGTSGTGAIYSYGTSNVSTERALGALASGANTAAFGVAITNNSANALAEFTIAFNGEAWRSSTSSTGTPNVLTFAYGLSSTAGLDETNFLSSALMTANSAGDILGPTPVAANAALNPPIVTPYSVTITGLNVAVGETIFLRWQDFNDQGNDAGLAIDDFSFNAVAVPAPGAAALLGLGGLLAARRRR